MNESANKDRDIVIQATELFEAVKEITDKGNNAEIKCVQGVFTVMEIKKRIGKKIIPS